MKIFTYERKKCGLRFCMEQMVKQPYRRATLDKTSCSISCTSRQDTIYSYIHTRYRLKHIVTVRFHQCPTITTRSSRKTTMTSLMQSTYIKMINLIVIIVNEFVAFKFAQLAKYIAILVCYIKCVSLNCTKS